ncbi:MAG: energy-coupling factor transporter transmembrane component T family protein [Candidatus Aminicenantia bacterium]
MIFEERAGFEIKADPRVKILFLIFSILLCLLPSKIYSSILLFSILVIISIFLKAIRSILRAKALLIIVFLFTLIVWLISRGLSYFQHSLIVALKLDSMIVAGITFISSTTQEELFFGLRKFYVPYRFSFAISLAMRFVPVILNLVDIVVQAQKVRGYKIDGRNPLKRVKNTVPLIGPVLLFVLRWTDKLSIALESRGFSSTSRSSYYEWKMKRRDFFLLLLMSAIFVLSLLFRTQNII